jgi:hypothetical protein
MNNKIVHILKGIKSLTQTELEKRLFKKNIDSFITNTEKKDLFFDLSQVGWISINAAFQLCLVIEKLKKNNQNIFIALPYIKSTEYELESKALSTDIKETLIKNRRKANEFLKVINFDKATLCEHLADKKEVLISEDFQFSKGELNPEYFYSVFYAQIDKYECTGEYYYSNIIPFRWINQDENYYDRLSKQIEFFLKKEEKGLQLIDVLSLKNVILSELMKNLKEHAGSETKHALFSLNLINSKSISLQKDINNRSVNSRIIENDFLEGIINSKINSLIEIYFGDTGEGICNEKLIKKYNINHNTQHKIQSLHTQNKILRWSFDKWSTSKDEELRGTKGLYRIHRIVNKYNGIIHVRSKKTDGGFQKGGRIESEWINNENTLYNHPGTFIQIKLCPQKEFIKYNMVTDSSKINRKKWKAVTYLITPESAEVGKFKKWFVDILQGEYSNAIIIFQPDKHELDIKSFFERIFLEISELRHPKGIILYTAISIGKDNLEGIVDSTNERIKRENKGSTTPENLTPDIEAIYDPVLVIGEDNSILWFGGNQSINEILNEMYNYETSYPKKLTQLKCFSKLEEKTEIFKYLQNDSSFFAISKNENILFDFTDIISLYEHILEEDIKTHKDSVRGKEICSPKLDICKKWIDISKILVNDKSTGYALALYTIMLNIKLLNEIDIENTCLFIDHVQQYRLAVEMTRLMGIQENMIINLAEDIDIDLPRRTKLFNENDNVIILTTVIASSETIRRLVKHVYRDKAKPLAIICLINNRKGKLSNILTTWNQNININSIISNNQPIDQKEEEYHLKNENEIKSLSDSLKNEIDLVIYSPKYKMCENHTQPFELDDKLKSLFKRTKSLHYNHYGKYNDRHFTFFLHKSKILKDKIIANEIASKIADWAKSQKLIGTYTIVLPDKNSTFLKLCIGLFDSKEKIETIIEFYRFNQQDNKPDNVVFFDFGSLTGNTINKIISSNPCKVNLLIITIFSQFKGQEKEFYSKIKKIKCEFIEKGDNTAKQLSIFDKEKKVSKNINMSYITLYDLPIYFYQSQHCPICQHIESLEFYKLKKSKYLKSFAEDRKLRLKIKDYNHIPDHPIDPYGSLFNSDEHRMSENLIMKMYEFKCILDSSISLTRSRIDLFNRIYSIYENKDDLLKIPDSDIYALIYLLSNEILWLQKEPLIFHNFRFMLYSISKCISTYDIDKLTEIFSKDLSRKIGFNLATRYKYAAISVFRSSNKFHFCKNLFSILSSAVIDYRIGDNIYQNTLYHINSIHMNRYNNSDVYYKDIENQINQILNSDLPLSKDQKEAIEIIRFNNKKNRKEIEIKDLSQIELFKKLKRDINNIYGVKGHPIHIEDFKSIRIDVSSKLLNDISQRREESTSYNTSFVHKQKNLMENYDKVRSLIILNIIPYIEAISNFEINILLSYSYNIFTKKYHCFLRIIDELENYIDEGSKDIFYLIDNQAKYIGYCKLINETFIHREESCYNIRNAELFNFLYSIPSNLKNIVNSVFYESDFRTMKINIDDSINIFVTKSLLESHLKLILGNIRKRQNENYGKAKENISKILVNCEIEIKAEINNEYVILTFIYSNTEKFDKLENPIGNLYQFDKALNNYGGNLTHNLQQDGNFLIKIEFLNYEGEYNAKNSIL